MGLVGIPIEKAWRETVSPFLIEKMFQGLYNPHPVCCLRTERAPTEEGD